MSGDNVIKVSKIMRDGFVEYRAEVRSVLIVPYFQSKYKNESRIPDEYVAATLANNMREFVNSSVLGECIETEYKKLGDDWTCPRCGSRLQHTS